jgi:uncharacterized RDD family membrane protein YckC
MQTDNVDVLNISIDNNYPGILQRVKALAIDSGILLLVFVMAFNIIDFMGDAPGYVRGGILIFMFFLYEPLMIASFGFTIGHFLMNLRVRNCNDHSKKILLPLAFLRSFVKGIFGWLSFLTIGFNVKRRALHDLASFAVVIEVK